MALGKPRKTRTAHGDVRWEVDCTRLGGKRHREYFATKGEADARQREVNQGERTKLNPAFDPAATLRAYSEHFLASRRGGWKPRTYRVNADTLRLHILPFAIGAERTLGDLRVRDLTRGQLKAFLLAKRDATPGYAAGTLRIVYATLRSVLNAALDDELIAANPGTRLGKYLARPAAEGMGTVKALDAEQLNAFLTTAKRESALSGLYLAGAMAGLRLGELCGWQLEDLHLEERTALVQRSLGQEQSMRTPTASATKTGKARTVDLAAELVAVLADVKAKRPALAMARAWRPVPPWVFVTGNGTPYSERNVSRDFKRVLRLTWPKARDEDPDPPEWDFSPHSLRHSFATLHLLAGEKPQWVQQQLGHASIKLTVDTYGSWIRERNPAAADRLAAVVNGTVNGA